MGLLAWIKKVRQRCEASDRLVVCDLHVGRLLASLKRDTNGAWPCVEVRNILEKLQSDEVLRGFHTEVINSRGIHSRGPRDGGQQERALAEKYGGYADACRLRWPRVSATLRSLAQFYASDARRMDERTEDAD